MRVRNLVFDIVRSAGCSDIKMSRLVGIEKLPVFFVLCVSLAVLAVDIRFCVTSLYI